MGCALTKLIWISDQDRSKFTIVLAPQLSCLPVNKIPMSYFGPSSVVSMQMLLCERKERPWTCVCIKGFVLHMHWLFCIEFFASSALKCQCLPFLEIVSSEKPFAMLHIRLLHKIKWYCIVSVYCLSCSSGQVIFWLGTRQLHENLVLTVQCYFLLQAE